MPVVDPIQTSFAGGELTPRLHGQVGSDVYKASLALCRNFQPTPQGSLLLRAGSRWMALRDSQYAGGGVVRALPVAGRQGWLVHFVENAAHIRSADGIAEMAGIVLKPGPDATYHDLIANRNFADQGLYWTTDGAGAQFLSDNGHDECALKSSGIIYQTVAAHETGNHLFRFTIPSQASASEPATPAPGLADGFRLVVLVYPDGDPDHPVLSFSVDRSAAESTWSEYCDVHFAFDVELEAGNEYQVEFRCVQIANPQPDPPLEKKAYLAGVSLWSPSGRDVITTPWTAAQAAELVLARRPDLDGWICFHPDVAPQSLHWAPYEGWVCEPVVFGGQPPEWGERNWPSAGVFHQGRLICAGTRNPANGFWGSKSWASQDLTATGSPMTWGDARAKAFFTFTLDTENPTAASAFSFRTSAKEAMRWLSSRQMLLAGTERGELSVRSVGPVLTTADVDVRPESGLGSAPGVQPVDVGAELAYLSRDGRKVRLTAWNDNRQAWTSKDLGFLGEHLTRDGIVDMAWVRDPHGVLAVLLEDGSLALCTYSAELGQAAWWRAALTGEGTAIESLAVTEGPSGSILWLGVQRTNLHTSAPVYSLERMLFGVEGMAHLDGYVRAYAGMLTGEGGVVPAGEAVLGAAVNAEHQAQFAHLAGQIVDAYLVTGGVNVACGQYVVSANGSVTVLYDAFETGLDEGVAVVAEFLVGTAFTGQATTLPLEAGGRRGTAQPTKRRWAKLLLRLADSAIPLLNGDRMKDADPAAALASPAAARTGDVQGVPVGWDERGAVTITQDLPARTEILALFGVLAAHEV